MLNRLPGGWWCWSTFTYYKGQAGNLATRQIRSLMHLSCGLERLIMCSHTIWQWKFPANTREIINESEKFWFIFYQYPYTWPLEWNHYSDVILMASQIAGVSIVYSIVCSGADQRKHQSYASLACARSSPVAGEFPTQRPNNAENVSIWWCHLVWIRNIFHCLTNGDIWCLSWCYYLKKW